MTCSARPDGAAPRMPRYAARRLDIADVERYRELRLLGLAESPQAFSSTLEDEREFPPERWLDRLRPSPDRFTLGAFAGDTMVGTVAFYREPRERLRHKGFVVGMYVAPEARCRGIGSMLLDHLVSEARRVPAVEQLLLCVFADNAPARALYHRHGFVVFGREPRALRAGDAYFDELHMIRML